jgi:hypothetical protein
MYNITKNGICAKHICVVDEVNKSVSTQECGLMFDFGNMSGWKFKTGNDCTFNTMFNCTFETLYGCTFKVGPNCTFNVGENCSLIRHDVSGVSELPDGVTVKLNGYEVSGFLVNTKEYVKKHMNDEDGLQFILENDEWTELDKH